jgi:nitrate/TMAO reductase-like tetraheme cytochrome c subunit
MTVKHRNPILALVVSVVSWVVAGCSGAPIQEEVTESERGAQVWRVTCARCHNLRPASEFASEQWPIIVNHMRTRQDLTKSDAEAVALFLQDLAERTSSSP